VPESGEEHWNRARQRLVFALDYPDLSQARAGAELVRDAVGVVKVGLQLFIKEGPAAVSLGRDCGLEVFLDLKLHDIPATVGRAVASAGSLGVRYLTVHASGSKAMLASAVERAAESKLTIVAVTVLTSLDQQDLARLGLEATPGEQARRLASIAWEAGVRAFVCSPAEAGSLRSELGSEAIIITPGIRPGGAATQDQKRVSTPADAIGSGADLLVVGRPIRDASDPVAAARAIVDEIDAAQRSVSPT